MPLRMVPFLTGHLSYLHLEDAALYVYRCALKAGTLWIQIVSDFSRDGAVPSRLGPGSTCWRSPAEQVSPGCHSPWSVYRKSTVEGFPRLPSLRPQASALAGAKYTLPASLL